MVGRLRVAHVTATFPPYQAGTGTVAYHNAAEMARRGHEVHVFTAAVEGAPADEIMEGVAVHRLRPWLKLRNAVLLPQLTVRVRTFDVVHLHLPFYGGAESMWALARANMVRLIVTHHQDVVLPGLMGKITEQHDRFFSQRLMELAQFACFTSLDYAEHSKFTQGSERAKSPNIVELPNGADIHHFSPGAPPAMLHDELQLAGRRVVLFVGALDRPHYFKGVDRFLEAASLLNHDDLFLIIVGSGDLHDEYQRKAAELGIQDHVAFPGFVPDDLLPGYYRLADVTVLPSVTMGEAFGLVLVESLACGTPVIASRLPGVRTVVADGVDGYLVEPGNVVELAASLDHLLGLPDTDRRAMGQAGRRKVEARYSWERVGDILEGLYVEVAGSGSGVRTAMRPAVQQEVGQ